MRISVYPDDKDYTRTPHRFKVTCDGKELKNCVTADEEKGEALQYVTDEKGNYILTPCHTEVKTRLIKGKIQIQFKKKPNFPKLTSFIKITPELTYKG